VLLDPEAEYMDPGSLHAVRIDRAHGVRMAVRHLSELGHEKIGYLGGVADRSRLDGYEAEVAELGIEPIVIDTDAWEGEFESGWHGGELFLALDPRPDAVQVFSDVTAMGFLAFLHEQGLRVPLDVAVVGFDDRQIASVCWPALTTVAQPNHEVGVAAAEILLDKIGGEPIPAEGWSQTVPTRLVVRDST
jgi:DNA-binding LacI/PurR family transcriptional regulator